MKNPLPRPIDYGADLLRKTRHAIDDLLVEASARLAGPAIVVSTFRESPSISLWNVPAREPTRDDLERRAYIPKDRVPAYLAAFEVIGALGNNDSSDELVVQDVFRCPLAQLPSLMNHIREAASYQGPLGYHARTMIKHNHLFN